MTASNIADGHAQLHCLRDCQLLFGSKAPRSGTTDDDLDSRRVGHRHRPRNMPGSSGQRRCPVQTGAVQFTACQRNHRGHDNGKWCSCCRLLPQRGILGSPLLVERRCRAGTGAARMMALPRSVVIWLVFFDSAMGGEAQKAALPSFLAATPWTPSSTGPVPMSSQMPRLYAAEAFIGPDGLTAQNYGRPDHYLQQAEGRPTPWRTSAERPHLVRQLEIFRICGRSGLGHVEVKA
jgi:hypothetical protein